MPSPFPGMDPYLEGRLWPDVHTSLATTIRQRLAPLVRPRYTVRLGVYVVEDSMPEAEVGIMSPACRSLARRGVAGWRRRGAEPRSEGRASRGGRHAAPLTIPVLGPVEARLVTVEYRHAAADTLVMAIEILSPINKTGEGLATYRRKRQRLHRAGAHLIEIDSIPARDAARGPPAHPAGPVFSGAHGGQAATTEIWPIRFQDSLPSLQVPLRPPDEDVQLNLQATLAAVYETAMYDLSIDYRAAPPPPVLSDDDARWVAELLRWGQ